MTGLESLGHSKAGKEAAVEAELEAQRLEQNFIWDQEPLEILNGSGDVLSGWCEDSRVKTPIP